MSFYQQIAPYYHHIFKINVHQVGFIRSKISGNDSSIIDIGCGIGTLSFELIHYYNNVLGIDMDAEMIQSALRNKKSNLEGIKFQHFSMLEIAASIKKESIDGIVCFGNTVAHLNSLDEIADFLQQSKEVLQSNGKLLLQIVNYDRILAKNVEQLPLIDNDDILFERNYSYSASANKIDFNTRLTIKSTQLVIENSIELYPILKKELILILKDAGFKNCNYYGNFKQDSYSIDSPALIVEAW